jgi:hypothetical protein
VGVTLTFTEKISGAVGKKTKNSGVVQPCSVYVYAALKKWVKS